jgi:hypothetical protein
MARRDLYCELSDKFITIGGARQSQIRVHGIDVVPYVNETVIAFVAPLGNGIPYERVGTLPRVKCPVAA